MSFILEALKKSENARQRQTGPGFANLPERVEARRVGIWPWILGAVLIINAVVIVIVLLRDKPGPGPVGNAVVTRPASAQTPVRPELVASPPGETVAAALPKQAAQSSVEAGTVFSPPSRADAGSVSGSNAGAVPGQTSSTTVRSLAEEAQSRTADTNRPVTSSDPAPVARAQSVPASRPASTARENDIARMPSVQELYLSGELTGPQFNLDLHVYYPERSRRVVFIGGNRYREGESLGQGVAVKEIIPAGVILEKGGRSYLLQAN